ncbi:hypothetical protein ACFL35_00715 [Candidatus Riflebacteria bacterium]
MRVLFSVILCLLACLPHSVAGELSGNLSAEGRIFFNDARYPGQLKNNGSLALDLEYTRKNQSGAGFSFAPFVRWDSVDSKRSHFDLREFNYLWLGNGWELRAGVGKVFWGVTEFVHLVDVVNQTDAIESLDDEEKLGQPMLHLSLPEKWGVVDLFLLPYFRERTFPGAKGRLRSAIKVDADNPQYESSDGEKNLDIALRYSHTIGNWDLGLYHFKGTGREPTLLLRAENNSPTLVPFYEQINQTGLDLQLTSGEFLYKLESIYRTGQGNDFFASICGVEYNIAGWRGSKKDLTIFGEWGYDSRGDKATSAYENDLMLGARLALNDPAGSEFFLGLIQDLNKPTRILYADGKRRIGKNWKAIFETWIFLDPPQKDILYQVRDDDFFSVKLVHYF